MPRNTIRPCLKQSSAFQLKAKVLGVSRGGTIPPGAAAIKGGQLVVLIHESGRIEKEAGE